ncbi:MAG: DNA primase [Actinomycetota bacterium]|nr:DNA primase [Actinomycetota bacterium]
MGIVDEDIAKVRAATDFVSLASERVALRRVGRRWVGLCPFHAERSPSFGLNAEQGLYYCFGCRASGDVITFVRELDHLDFAEAVEYLAGRAGVTLRYDDGTGGRDHQRRTKVHETLAQAVAWYHDRLLSSPDAAAARAYLRAERGYDGDLVRRYQLGWAPDGWDQLIKALKLPASALVDAGLAYVNDRGRHNDFFRGRLLFPIFEPGGRPVGAGGRILPGGRGPKYKNTANTVVYDKSRTLYGLNWAKKAVVDTNQVVVCEGYTDVIGMGQAGVDEAVATCGTSLADGHIRHLTHFARRIVLAYDADEAGQGAAEQYYDWEQRFEVDIRVASLPRGSDPGELARRQPEALRRAVAEARPYLAFRLDRLLSQADLDTAEGRARAAVAAVALVGDHPSELVRDQYLMEVADRCRISPDRLRQLPPAPASDRSRPSQSRPGQSRPGQSRPGRGDGDPSTSGGPVEVADLDAGALDAVDLGGPELEALLLAVHRPEEVARRLEACLFDHALARAAFAALCSAATLHDAIADADPQVAALLRRLAVETCEADTDDILVRLVERAGARAVAELLADIRQAEDATPWAQSLSWLKLTLENLRAGEHRRDAEERLVRWIVARTEGVVPLPSRPDGPPGAETPQARPDFEGPDRMAQ